MDQISYIKHHDIDRQKWDQCIMQSINSRVYAYSWYLDTTAPGWEALVLNDYEAVFPLTIKRKLVSYLYQPFFTQQLGLFYTNEKQLQLTKQFIKLLPSHILYVDIYLNDAIPDFQLNGARTIARKNYVLSLDNDYIGLYRMFSEHTRRNIKKAEKERQLIRPCDVSDVISQYRKNKGEETKELQLMHYEMLEKLLNETEKRDALLTLGIYNEFNKLLSSAAFIVTPGRIYYMMGSVNDEGKEKRSMYMLFNEVIKQYAYQDFLLDFEGSEKAGIARFFKGFGAVKRSYKHLKINRLPFFVRWLKS